MRREEGYVRTLIQVRDRGANITHDAGMPQFFFDLHECGRVLIDDEGVEMPDAEAARTNAVHEARQIMAAEVSHGRLCLACHIEVQDEARNVVLVVAFADAIVLSGYQPKAIHS
jgi:hypothetical protein